MVVGRHADAESALRSLYRAERLFRSGALPRLKSELEKEVRERGFAILASRHESNTGSALWTRLEGEEFVTYTRPPVEGFA